MSWWGRGGVCSFDLSSHLFVTRWSEGEEVEGGNHQEQRQTRICKLKIEEVTMLRISLLPRDKQCSDYKGGKSSSVLGIGLGRLQK